MASQYKFLQSIIEWGDGINGWLVSMSPTSYPDTTGKMVVRIIFWLPKKTINMLITKDRSWELKNNVDRWGKQKSDTQLYSREYPAEQVLLPVRVLYMDGSEGIKTRIICGIDCGETPLTHLYYDLLTRVRHYETEMDTLKATIAVKEESNRVSRTDLKTEISEIAEIYETIKGKSQYAPPEQEEQKQETSQEVNLPRR